MNWALYFVSVLLLFAAGFAARSAYYHYQKWRKNKK